MTPTLRHALASLLFGVLVYVAMGSAVAAQPTTNGPQVVLENDELAPRDRLQFTLSGFEGPAVIITVCGNDALRGSVDCNTIQSEGLRLNREGGPTVSSIPVPVPPMPCPCIVRVADTNNTQIAVAPLVIIGHPVAPTVPPAEFVQPIVVSVVSEPADVGFADRLRSSAGGATAYDVTVEIRNRSAQRFENIKMSGSAGRSGRDDLVSIDFADPGVIEPGQTWTEQVTAMLPSPVWGSVEWRTTAAGSGPSVTATETTTHMPVLLIVLIVVLVIDILLLLVRLILRLRRRSRDSGGDSPGNPFLDGPGGGDGNGTSIETDLLWAETMAADSPRTPELVS